MTIPVVTNPVYSYPFPDSHRFPMEKFGLLAQYVSELPKADRFKYFRPGRAKESLLTLAHCSKYLHRFIHNGQTKQEIRRMGLPWSQDLVRRTLISPNGTLLTANLALQNGIACHLAGGTHHAHYDFASGFCIINDLAVGALALLKSKKVERVLIFDCDVHQGDGTARILEAVPEIYTCSVHCEKNFPVRKAASDLDINIPVGARDKEYLEQVEQALTQALEASKPDLVIYDAGVDIYQHDPLGLLDITEQGIHIRDHLVLSHLKTQHIPVATVIGGGYDDDRKALARRHGIVVEQALSVFES